MEPDTPRSQQPLASPKTFGKRRESDRVNLGQHDKISIARFKVYLQKLLFRAPYYDFLIHVLKLKA